ncbi:MAG: helix-hairpin-helix domain-containing protein [Tannerella sp.]|nr:helix-hairpin-helix domain-containing protein [Tannerella sp.]
MFLYFWVKSPVEEGDMAEQPEIARTDSVAAQPPSPNARSRTSPPRDLSGRTRPPAPANRPAYTRTEKFAAGTVVELNAADTFTLKKVPGIGSYYARNIVRYRDMLGGFYAIEQLGEVYNVDADKYAELLPWFTVDASLVRKMPVNTLSVDSLSRHPYISRQQARAIDRLRKQKKSLDGWENLRLLDVFTGEDVERIKPYLSFEADPVAAQPLLSAAENRSPSDAGSQASPPRDSVSGGAEQTVPAGRPVYTRVEKFAAGTVVELNTADTFMLKKIPGIGSYYARNIVRYRDLLGGFYAIAQLGEVYDVDANKYAELSPWFTVDASLVRKMPVNTLSVDLLSRHPYISRQQARAIDRLRKQKKGLDGWENLRLLDVFTGEDEERIKPYLSFE